MNSVDQTSVPPVNAGLSSSVARRLFWHIVPVFFVLYVLNYIDRANVSFASLNMNPDLGFTPQIYGTGAGTFFVGYLLAGIPVSLLVLRFGARRSLSVLMVAWGAAATAMALTRDVTSFYAIRFLVGVGEAGFLPAMMFYLSQWFPARERARAVGAVSSATVISLVIGGPLSGALLEMPPWLGLASWKWLFIIEGFPAVIAGIIVFFVLPDRPAEAGWLTDNERRELASVTEQDRVRETGRSLSGAWEAILDWRVWFLFLFYVLIAVSFYGTVLWLPQIIQSLHDLSTFHIGLVSAIPFLLGAAAMIFGGWRSDKSGQRYPYTILGPLLGAVGFTASGLSTSQPLFSLIALTLGIACFNAVIGPFWSIATALLRGRAAAVGFAIITEAGSIGGFLGSRLLGDLRQLSGDFHSGLLLIAACLAAAGLLMAVLAWGGQRRSLGAPARAQA